MEDICELSSILDQEQQEKQRLERELQLIDKAIRNQEGRFENEIEKHQEIVKRGKEILRRATDVHETVEIMDAKLEQISKDMKIKLSMDKLKVLIHEYEQFKQLLWVDIRNFCLFQHNCDNDIDNLIGVDCEAKNCRIVELENYGMNCQAELERLRESIQIINSKIKTNEEEIENVHLRMSQSLRIINEKTTMINQSLMDIQRLKDRIEHEEKAKDTTSENYLQFESIKDREIEGLRSELSRYCEDIRLQLQELDHSIERRNSCFKKKMEFVENSELLKQSIESRKITLSSLCADTHKLSCQTKEYDQLMEVVQNGIDAYLKTISTYKEEDVNTSNISMQDSIDNIQENIAKTNIAIEEITKKWEESSNIEFNVLLRRIQSCGERKNALLEKIVNVSKEIEDIDNDSKLYSDKYDNIVITIQTQKDGLKSSHSESDQLISSIQDVRSSIHSIQNAHAMASSIQSDIFATKQANESLLAEIVQKENYISSETEKRLSSKRAYDQSAEAKFLEEETQKRVHSRKAGLSIRHASEISQLHNKLASTDATFQNDYISKEMKFNEEKKELVDQLDKLKGK